MQRLERASPAAAESATGKSSAPTEATTAKARPAGTGPGRGHDHLVHVRRHAMHRRREEDWVEGHAVAVSSGRGVPTRRIFHEAGEGLRPVMFHAESHGVRKKFLKCIGR